jgi:predicted transcriptional regulator
MSPPYRGLTIGQAGTSTHRFADPKRNHWDVTLKDLRTADHHSIRLRIGIDDKAAHQGGVNIFGKGFGNHDQDILMRLHLKPRRT